MSLRPAPWLTRILFVSCGGAAFGLACSADPDPTPAASTHDAGAEAAVVGRCPLGLTNCRGCVDVRVHRSHCGRCDAACATGQICDNGTCTLSCAPGQQACGGACVTLATDATNCGACGKACSAGSVCSNGQCALSCGPPLSTCAGAGGGSACADTRSDPSNCGACGARCADGSRCETGQCRLTCQAGTTVCGGTCVDVERDVRHCGGCDRACTAGQVCAQGACATVCPPPLVACTTAAADAGTDGGGPGYCASLADDANDCGACGVRCTVEERCSRGRCCPAGFAACADGGPCLDVRSDPANCGDCGAACPAAAPQCTGGRCAQTYDVAVSDAVNVGSVCGAHHTNGCDGADYGIRWSDSGPTGAAPSRIVVNLSVGVACVAGTAPREVVLNGVSAGSFFQEDRCDTCPPSLPDTLVEISLTPAARAAYVTGGVNTLLVRGSTGCEGLAEHGPWALAVARVVVSY